MVQLMVQRQCLSCGCTSGGETVFQQFDNLTGAELFLTSTHL